MEIGIGDQQVIVGIRPEGFILDERGPFKVKLNRVEVMGRDTSVISQHSESLSDSVRSIIPAENTVVSDGGTVRFDLKPTKVHLFDPESEARLRFSGAPNGGR